MTVIAFPYNRPRIEVFTIRDRTSCRTLHIFEWVGHDERGSYRIDVTHCHNPEDFASAMEDWKRTRIPIVDTGVRL